MNTPKLILVPSLVLGTPLLATLARAQAVEPVVRLDEVTVTATLREESLLDVPVAVSVVDGKRAEQANLNNLFSIASEVPSLTFRANSSNKDTSLFVRGIGTVTTSPGVEPSVSTVIDGVVFARPGQATLDLFDVDRIEVLRGPQGTLFGKNASAGVVNIVTKDPSKDPHGFVDASYFTEGDEYRFRLGASGEIAKDLARVSVNALYGSYDGNVKNVFNGETVNGYEKKGVRSKLVITPHDKLKITLAADYLQSEDDNPAVVKTTTLTAYPTGVVSQFPAFANALRPVVASEENRSINTNFRTWVDDRNYGASAIAELGLGEHTLTSITGWRHWSNDQYQDGDRLSAAIAGLNQSHDKGILHLDHYSEELRLTSPSGGFFEYVGGLYFFTFDNDEIYRRDLRRIVSGNPVDDYGRADYGTSGDNYAAFGEGTFNFTDRFRAIAGLRVTHDTLEFQHRRFSTSASDLPGIRSAYAGSGETDETGVSGRTGLQFDLTKQASIYGTYSRGYKGPAYNVFFNHRALDADALAPETSDSFEVGAKTSFWSGRGTASLAAFHTSFDDFQANFTDIVAGTPVTRLINAGTVYTKGLEADVQARVTDGLTLRASAAYTRARVDTFRLPAGLTPAQIAAADIDGGRLPFSPDWKAIAGANYLHPLSKAYALEFDTSYNWQSSVQYDLGQFADTIQSAYGILNGSIALANSASGWRVALLAKNITNASYASFLSRGGQSVARIVPRDDSRFFGINIRKDF